jgi:hypothetical protein
VAEYSVDLVPVYDSAAVVALTSEARAVAVTGMLTFVRLLYRLRKSVLTAGDQRCIERLNDSLPHAEDAVAGPQW